MDTSWQLKDLHEHLHAHGPASRHLIKVLESVGRYIDIFRYHLFLARDAMKGIIVEDDPYGIMNLEYIFDAPERQDEFIKARIASEANILGCIHSARSLLDVFASLVNGLVLNSVIRADQCDIKKVTSQLPASALKSRLQVLLESHWFGYVSAFINTAKHRQLVPHGFHVSFESGTAGIQLGGFEYRGSKYPARSADEVLRGVLEVGNTVIHCGQLLNDLVLQKE